jgi:polyhydroxyalkanoate synthesis regulator phasin
MPQTPDLTKYLDAGAEFVALSRKQARARAQELVQQGQLAQNQVQGFVDGLVEGSRRRTDVLMDGVRQEIQRQVQAVGIATKDDLVKLEAKLTRQTKGSAKPAGSSATKSGGTGAKKAPKKKSDAAKQATKRAAGAKKKSKKTAKKTAKSVSTGVASS